MWHVHVDWPGIGQVGAAAHRPAVWALEHRVGPVGSADRKELLDEDDVTLFDGQEQGGLARLVRVVDVVEELAPRLLALLPHRREERVEAARELLGRLALLLAHPRELV